MSKQGETPLNVDIPSEVQDQLAEAKDRWGFAYKKLVAWAIADLLDGMDLQRIMESERRFSARAEGLSAEEWEARIAKEGRSAKPAKKTQSRKPGGGRRTA